MPVRINIKRNWSGDISKGISTGLLDLTTDIHRRSIILAPRDTAALVNSGRIDPIVDGYKITFGSPRVPYARRRHFENNKNPQTKGYLAKAGDAVMRGDTGKYFRGRV